MNVLWWRNSNGILWWKTVSGDKTLRLWRLGSNRKKNAHGVMLILMWKKWDTIKIKHGCTKKKKPQKKHEWGELLNYCDEIILFFSLFPDYYYLQGGVRVENIESGTEVLGFKAQLYHLYLLAGWPSTSDLTSLCFGSSSVKIGTVIVSNSSDYCELADGSAIQ